MATAAPMPDLSILQRINREALELLIEAAITWLDLADGDLDLEDDRSDFEDGDEDCCPCRDDTGTCTWFDGYGDGKPGDPADAEDDARWRRRVRS
jgi:hypothetical protein